jgi:O-antigen/teichoic acid export membrane protein
MGLILRLSKDSFFYSLTHFIERAISIFLLPVYLKLLTNYDYGVFALITSINAFLQVVFELSLRGSIQRFYFKYRNDQKKLAEFFGTIFTFSFLFCLVMGIVLIIGKNLFLIPFLKDIPFSPYMLLGIISVMFYPHFHLILSMHQASGQVKRYSLLSVSSILFRVIMTIFFILALKMGAEGPLLASALASFVYFFLTFFLIKKSIKICIKKNYLKESLAYALPLIPTSVISSLENFFDKIFINIYIGVQMVGIYHVGFQIGYVIRLLILSVNRAYIPLFFSEMEDNQGKSLKEFIEIGKILVTIFSLLALATSFFSKEILLLINNRFFLQSVPIVPFIAFSSVFYVIYYLYINIVFYYSNKIKFIPITTLSSALVNVSLNYLLVKKMGIQGAAIANLTASIIASISAIALVSFLKLNSIQWPIVKFIVIVLTGFLIAFFWNMQSSITEMVSVIISKFLILAVYFFGCSFLLWNNPQQLIKKIIYFYHKKKS